MLLYVFRHGEADPYSSDDASRELTSTGRMQNDIAVADLLNKRAKIDVLLCSPLTRAKQTAASLLISQPDLVVRETENLIPESSVKTLLSYIDEIAGPDNLSAIMLIGHNPLLSKLVSVLVDGPEDGNYHLETSNIVCLEVDVLAPACAKLAYWINPWS